MQKQGVFGKTVEERLIELEKRTQPLRFVQLKDEDGKKLSIATNKILYVKRHEGGSVSIHLVNNEIINTNWWYQATIDKILKADGNEGH